MYKNKERYNWVQFVVIFLHILYIEFIKNLKPLLLIHISTNLSKFEKYLDSRRQKFTGN